MLIELLKRAYERQKAESESPGFDGPLDLISELGRELQKIANVAGDPVILRLALATTTSPLTLKGAMEMWFTEEFLKTLGNRTKDSESMHAVLLGGLVTLSFMDLLTPRTGQVKLKEAREAFTAELGEEPRLVQAAVVMLATVGRAVSDEYRPQVRSFLEACVRHCEGTEVSKVVADLERELAVVVTRWHSFASGYRYADHG